jgi:hypothetical protein
LRSRLQAIGGGGRCRGLWRGLDQLIIIIVVAADGSYVEASPRHSGRIDRSSDACAKLAFI